MSHPRWWCVILGFMTAITVCKRVGNLAVILLATTSSPFLAAQGKKLDPSQESCKAFVKEFYTWYVPKTLDMHVDSLDLALKERRSTFSSELVKGIEEVDAYATRNQDAGLDFDPILNTNGDEGDYVVGESSVERGVCRIDVYRQHPGEKARRVVIPELNFDSGKWLFVNFHYPESPYPQSENLVRIIKAYLDLVRDSRTKLH